jgi:N-acetylglucosamine kinase-like BadF-type ATPase
MSEPLVIGLDAGGTKTAALAAPVSGGPPRRFEGPGAHALRDGPETAADRLVALVAEARGAFGGATLGGVAAGLAGAGRDDARSAVADALRRRLGGDAPIAVTHDAEVAFEAAWGDGSGALLLVGTGSLVWARTEAGDVLRAGGWGADLGDDAGGTALGRGALRAVLAAHDGGPPTDLAERAAEEGLASGEAVIRAVYVEGRPLSAFAPLLLAAAADGDWEAGAVLTRETNALAQQVGWLATRAGDGLRQRLAYTGGLAREAVYRESLEAALERHLPGWTVGPCTAEPVEGALALARRLAVPAGTP